MAESDFNQEKTEEPSARRITQAREKGNVPRSRELGTLCIMLAGSVGLIFLIPQWVDAFSQLFALFLDVPRELIFDPVLRMHFLWQAVEKIGYALLPFFLLLMVVSILGQLMVGGWNFTLQSVVFSFEKLDPVQGVQRIFTLKSLVELFKSLAKFLLVAGCAALVLYLQMPRLLSLSQYPLKQSFSQGLHIVGWGCLAVTSALIVIAAVDIPFQLWNYRKSLRMTKQEVRDELKETEGRPETKHRVRHIQRNMAYARMMTKVPLADLIITNPDHYAVALKYNEKEDAAPIVLAKGADHMAFRIMEVGRHHKITILRVPPLARSVYFTTELEKQIPDGLYLAVAQILAYVYQLKQYKKGQGAAPGPVPKYVIPEPLKH